MTLTPTINGIHKENKGFSWNIDRCHAITSSSAGCTILDTMLTDVENGWWYPKLRQEFGPDFLIHIRMYSEAGWENPDTSLHWCDVQEDVWAREIVRRLTQERLRYNGILPIDDPNVIITFANEQDLAVEGHSEAADWDHPAIDKPVYGFIWIWNRNVLLNIMAYYPNIKAKFATNPLAGGHDVNGYPPDYEYQMDEFKFYVRLCHYVALHAYFYPGGTGTRPDNNGYWYGIRCLRPPRYREESQGFAPINGIPDPGGVVSQYPNKPWIVTEFGNFRHFDASDEGVAITIKGYNECYSAYASKGCRLVTPFIWNCGDEHRENRIRGNDKLIDALITMPRYKQFQISIPSEPQEPEVIPFRFAFQTLAERLGNMGHAIEEIQYDNWGNARQTTSTGVAYSFKLPTGEWRTFFHEQATGVDWYL